MLGEHGANKRSGNVCVRLFSDKKKQRNWHLHNFAKHFILIFDDEKEDASVFNDFICEDEPKPEISKYHDKLIENKINVSTEEPEISNIDNENRKLTITEIKGKFHCSQQVD